MISSETSSHLLSLYQEKWFMLKLHLRMSEITERGSTPKSTLHNRELAQEEFCSLAAPDFGA